MSIFRGVPDVPKSKSPDQDLILDARSMRVLAHPVRIKIMGLLRTDGAQTSTTLANRLSLNTGATSYHLRQLAEFGMIEEDTERGTARERWWTVPSRSTQFRYEDLDEPEWDTAHAYLQALGLFYTEHLQRAIDEFPSQPDEWRDASTFSDWAFLLSPGEARQLLDDLYEVIGRYRTYDQDLDDDSPEDARLFHVQLQAFRLPGH